MNNIKICKLNEKLIDDYLYFFENVAHTDNKQWDRCYCLDYCSTNNLNEVEQFKDPDVRRHFAITYIKKGIIKGYLAYENDKVIGWCNVNDRNACLNCSGWKAEIDYENINMEEKVKSIFCFTIAPDMRRKHVATKLLEEAINDAIKDGYDYIEGYPNKENLDMYYSYVGHKEFYEKHGFIKVAESNYRFIFRKSLKNI